MGFHRRCSATAYLRYYGAGDAAQLIADDAARAIFLEQLFRQAFDIHASTPALLTISAAFSVTPARANYTVIYKVRMENYAACWMRDRG